MSTDTVAGFWSYAREDDKLDDGTILKLARLIVEEFALLSGEPLDLFIDRDSIDWGDAWRERLNSALAQTTFFIPVITPRYFSRDECRKELLEFSAKATDELLLPILYVKPSGFTEESSDEAVALIARTQFVDWQRLRLQDLNSRKYRKAINALAKRIIKIAESVAETQLNHELAIDLNKDGPEGIAELIEKIMALLPEWLDAVMGDRISTVQLDATWHQLIIPVNKLRKAHAPPSAVLAAQMRVGKETLSLMERRQKEAVAYHARSVQLDPYVSALARLIREHPESYDLAAPIREAIDEAMANMRRREEVRKRANHSIQDHLKEWKHLGRVFQKCIAVSNSTGRMRGEGSSIVQRWDSELKDPALKIAQNELEIGQNDESSLPPS